MKLAIAGCRGRMGQTLIKAALATPGVTLVMASEREGGDIAEAQAQLAALGAKNVLLTTDYRALAKAADAVIDFTTPEATLALAEAIAERGGIHIIGTTGLDGKQSEKIKTLSSKARIVMSGNFSLGVALLETLVERAAKTLGEEYDIEIFEAHHQHKKDAPSGTALMLGRAAASGRKVDLEKKKVSARDGITGERKPGDIGFSVQRGGDIVGIHTVTFAGPGEVVELKHQGFSRDIYANGAIRAALWAQDKKPGLYSIKDVLAL